MHTPATAAGQRLLNVVFVDGVRTPFGAGPAIADIDLFEINARKDVA